MTIGPDSDAFASQEPYLRALAYRFLQKTTDVDDIMQEAWIRYSQANKDEIVNLEAWLTTVVTRLCLDTIRQNQKFVSYNSAINLTTNNNLPEANLELISDVESAFKIILAELTPSQQISFILHDIFSFTFSEIGSILGISEVAARRQASRARAIIQNSNLDTAQRENNNEQQIVSAFLTAAQQGDIEGLISVLHPEVTRIADSDTVKTGEPSHISGIKNIINETITLQANAQDADVYLLSRKPVILVGSPEKPRLLLTFKIYNGKIYRYNVISDYSKINSLMLSGMKPL